LILKYVSACKPEFILKLTVGLRKDTAIKEPEHRASFKTLLPLFVLAHFAHHLLTALLTPLLPFIRDEFSLNYTQSTLIVSSYSISTGVSQIPAGWLADRIGPHILINVGICGVALTGFLLGLSPTYTMLLVFLVLMGVAAGGYHPAAAPLVSKTLAAVASLLHR
jgi:MFS family permease